MQVWKGWTAAYTPTKRTLTWSEWSARNQRTHLPGERDQAEGAPFSEWELVHLSFVRWLYRTGRFGPLAYERTEREAM